MLLEKRLKDKLHEIKKIIDRECTEIKDQKIGLLTGASGIALFQFYYAHLFDEETQIDLGIEIITKIMDTIREGYSFPTYCDGITGACWTLEKLMEESFLELDDPDLLANLDTYLYDLMLQNLNNKNYDFLHGAIGYGVYFLKRYENTTSSALKKNYEEYLYKLIQGLKNTSNTDNNGRYWDYTFNNDNKEICCNLSLSHGIASIINFLSRLGIHQVFYPKVVPLINETVQYLLNHKSKNPLSTYTFPHWVSEDTGISRLAWCYGDLGIGISLLRAGELLKNDEMYEEAMTVLKHTTKRKNRKEAGIIDSGLCHGVYGVLLIYNFLYKKTKDVLFKEATDFWAEQALDMATHQNGYAGYMGWKGEKKQWEPDTCILEGIAGMGLAILSYLFPEKITWDECLLIS